MRHTMVQVDFSDEERLRRDTITGSGTTGGLTGWFIRYKFAQDEEQANQVLAIVLVGILALTAILAAIGLGFI